MNINWKEIIFVVAFGAIGGLVSIVYSYAVGNPPVLGGTLLVFPAYVLLGAVAAFVGVYLLTKTDTSDMKRCLAFALICGIFWSPVFEGMTEVIESNKEKQLKANVAQSIEQINMVARNLPNTPSGEVSSVVNSTEKEVSKLVANVSKVNDVQLVIEAYDSIENVKESLEEIKANNPEDVKRARNAINKSLSNSSYPRILNNLQRVKPPKKY
jgi:hypothetical protein